jgi:hypothetical protein
LKPELAEKTLKLANMQKDLRDIQLVHSKCAASRENAFEEAEERFRSEIRGLEARYRQDLAEKEEIVLSLRREIDCLTADSMRRVGDLKREVQLLTRDRIEVKEGRETIVKALYKCQSNNQKLEGDVSLLSKELANLRDDFARSNLRAQAASQHSEELEKLLVQKDEELKKTQAEFSQQVGQLIWQLKELANRYDQLDKQRAETNTDYEHKIDLLKKDTSEKKDEIIYLLQEIEKIKFSAKQKVIQAATMLT